jgi:hypothetical protein
LGRLHACDFRQRFTRDCLNIVVLQSRQTPEIKRESVNSLSRNGRAVSFLQPAQNGRITAEMQESYVAKLGRLRIGGVPKRG